MQSPPSLRTRCALVALTLGLTTASVAAQTQPPPPTVADHTARLPWEYVLTSLRTAIRAAVPKLDEPALAAFEQARAAEAAAKSALDRSQQELQRADAAKDAARKTAATKAQQAAEGELARAQADTLTAARPLLRQVGPFLASDALDAQLIPCAVLANASPRDRSVWDQKGTDEASRLDRLLAQHDLMRQMLVADGAKAGEYGRAMQIYTRIQAASTKARGGILQRLALGTSLEHAVPVKEFGLSTEVDPVQRYLEYERAFCAGELDPAFAGMTTWECRLITNCDAPDEQLRWARQMLRDYRPDIVLEPDYRWRYAKIVKTDVVYKNPEWTSSPHTYAQILAGGGKCGPRAWFGRFALRSFGIPTWGVRQQGHAALSHWTPDGWTINFGADWRYNWWEGRPGPDFLLETRARRHPQQYLGVLRAQWIGDALGEPKVDPMQNGSGGTWQALALQLKKAIVADAGPAAHGRAAAEPADVQGPTQAELLAARPDSAADRQIAVDRNGAITVPAVACSSPLRSSGKVLFLKSFAGGMQLHLSRAGDEALEYAIEVPRAGSYALVARVVTVNQDQHLLVAANDAKTPIDLALPYTVGSWQETGPVAVPLREGRNVLHFTRPVPSGGLSIQQFTLTPVQ